MGSPARLLSALLAAATSLGCTLMAAAIALWLRLGAHILNAQCPRTLSFLLLLQLAMLVGAVAAPSTLWVRSLGAALSLESLVQAAPVLALVASSGVQLLMIGSFVLYRRELIHEQLRKSEVRRVKTAAAVAEHSRRFGSPKPQSTVAATASSETMMV